MRSEKAINKSWLFVRADAPSKKQRVNLPHSVDLTPANSSGGCNYQGKCTYTHDVLIPKNHADGRIIVDFNGAMGISTLFVNGIEASQHFCGYTPFVKDITHLVKFGEKNSLSLELDNSDNTLYPVGKAQADLDFSYEGGLYRTAKIMYLPPLHITHALVEDEVSGGGVFVYAENITAKSAEVYAKIHVRNAGLKKQSYKLKLDILREGKAAGTACVNEALEAGDAAHSTLCIKLENPELWGINAPNMYIAKISIIQNGKLIDKVSVDFGVRDFKFSYNDHFVLNGEAMRLSGGNYHQTYPIIGNGVPTTLLRRDVLKMRKLGLVNLRSHYPFADEVVSECNRSGMTLLVSNPGWQFFEEGVFAENLITNMRTIVRWQRNNPCIILWEPMPNESVVPQEFQQRLNDIVHEEYPYSCCYTASDHGPTDISYRMYDPGMLEPGMEGYSPLKRYGAKSDMPVWIREYNDAPDNWQDQSCAWRSARGFGDGPQLRAVQRMLGQDSQCENNNYIDAYNNKLACGYGIWPAIEHNRGYHINPCWGGFFDLFRIPKFTAMFMESQQCISDVGCILYIANWWTDISPVDVTVFSNAPVVRLYHNNVLVEERHCEDIAVAQPPFVFKDVHNRFKGRDRSTLRAEAIVNCKTVKTVTIKTPGVATHFSLLADTEGIAPMIGDIIVVRCSALDDANSVVPYTTDNHPILFKAKGGEIIGNEAIGANPVRPEAGIAAVLVRVKSKHLEISAEMYWPHSNARAALAMAKLTLDL